MEFLQRWSMQTFLILSRPIHRRFKHATRLDGSRHCCSDTWTFTNSEFIRAGLSRSTLNVSNCTAPDPKEALPGLHTSCEHRRLTTFRLRYSELAAAPEKR